ncbi:unnamed protein product [Miscanthus lutarioriparius]|uniref:Retrotransposon gag domain-containing protein n=1 Tax=Miscanthus lutarioriparius TaxID=422564 RepID=A0A811NX03_9POAL|nr:unnamed protein product [Miscanthus lutarioriparius]
MRHLLDKADSEIRIYKLAANNLVSKLPIYGRNSGFGIASSFHTLPEIPGSDGAQRQVRVRADPEPPRLHRRAIQAQEERTTALDVRVTSLEKVCHTQAHAAVLFDVRVQDFEQRIAEAELRMGDLELIHVYELRDERDERVSTLESAAAVLEDWRPFVDGTLDDIRLEIKRLKDKVSTHHFISTAARWLQSIERNLPHDWQTFCRMIHQRFSCDQHELLIRQLYHIKQLTTVQDYIERFTTLVEQLSAYANPDPLYYTTRFIDGLRHDIRSIVMVQRPGDLDSACTLALLQEEALDPGPRREFKKSDNSIFNKSANIKGALPMPPPIPRPHVTNDEKKAQHAVTGASTDDKLSAVRTYRKARGLCIRCGDKWQPGHKCNLQLHVLQEFFDLCHEDYQEPDTACDQSPDDEGQLNMLLSAAATSGQLSSRTLQFLGVLGGIEVGILVDSGSSHSFLSSSIAAQLAIVTHTSRPISVRLADGGTMQCTEELSAAEWSVQGYSFHSNFKILPLSSFDMIVGMDWLEAFSLMKIHWLQRWISLPYGRSTAVLHGFLQRRMHPRGSGSVAEVLVKWSGISEELSTWEDVDHLKQLFPFAPAWGHAGSQGKGSVIKPHTPAQPKEVKN